MDELIKQVSQKANISPDQAKSAVDTVLAFLTDKLPAPVVDQVKAALSGQQVDASAVTNALGGLFGGKQ
jgi:nucleoid DNA-binding protein